MGMTIELIDRLSLLNELNDKFQSIADINEVVIEQPTVEAIPKDQYEARLKADMAAMLTELQLEIEELPTNRMAITDSSGLICYGYSEYEPTAKDVSKIIQQKINVLQESEDNK